jgi:Flp pilus assembly protein TadG
MACVEKPATRCRQRAIALIETIVVTPLLLFLVVLTAEVTNGFVEYNTLAKSVRNSTRYVASRSLLGTTGTVVLSAPLTAQARNLVVYGNVIGSGSPILSGLTIGDVQVSQIAGSRDIQVSVSYQYTGLLGGSLPTFGLGTDPGLSITFRATVAMRSL